MVERKVPRRLEVRRETEVGTARFLRAAIGKRGLCDQDQITVSSRTMDSPGRPFPVSMRAM